MAVRHLTFNILHSIFTYKLKSSLGIRAAASGGRLDGESRVIFLEAIGFHHC